MDFHEYISSLKFEISDGNHEKVISELNKLALPGDLGINITMLSNRFKTYQRNEMQGTNSFEHTTEYNRIIKSLTKIVDSLDSSDSTVAFQTTQALSNIEAEKFDREILDIHRIIDEGAARSEAGRWLAHQRPALEIATINEVKSKYYQFLFEESNDSPKAFFLVVMEFICLVMIEDITVTPQSMKEYLIEKGVEENPSHKAIYRQLFGTMIEQVELKKRNGSLPISQEAQSQLFFFLKEFQKDYN